MDFDERLNDYKEKYSFELLNREKIEARIKTPFAMFLIVFGLIAYLFKETIANQNFDFHWLFWVVFLLSCLLFIVSIFFFIKAIHGYHYLLLPTPEILEQYLADIISNYNEVDRGRSREWAKESYKEYLFESYVKYTTQNTKNNDTKALNISRCLTSLIASFIIICFSYLPYYDGLMNQKENIDVQKTRTTTTTTTEGCSRPTT